MAGGNCCEFLLPDLARSNELKRTSTHPLRVPRQHRRVDKENVFEHYSSFGSASARSSPSTRWVPHILNIKKIVSTTSNSIFATLKNALKNCCHPLIEKPTVTSDSCCEKHSKSTCKHLNKTATSRLNTWNIDSATSRPTLQHPPVTFLRNIQKSCVL